MFEAARPFGLVGLLGRPKATPSKQIKMRPWRLISMNSKIRMLPKLTAWTQVISICTIWPKEFRSRICTVIYSKAWRCTFFGEWKKYCSSKFVQLLLLNRGKARWSKRRAAQGFYYINSFSSNFFGPNSKTCTCKVRAAWGRVSRGLTVMNFEAFPQYLNCILHAYSAFSGYALATAFTFIRLEPSTR